MDDVIFENSKAQGIWRFILTDVMEKQIFPAINVMLSRTRKEELLIPKEDLEKIWLLLLRVLRPLDTVEATELLIEKLKRPKLMQTS